MARRIETLFLPGPAGKLEALLEEPEDRVPVEAALICHPSPIGGGTMHNKVVYRMARGLRKTGCAVLRFNYRGVNLSEGAYDHGIGETEDARVALAELGNRYPNLPLLVGGFSFGSRIALRLTSQEASARRTLAVGFPTRGVSHDFAYQLRVPKFFVQSTHDEFGPKPEFTAFYDSLLEPKQLQWVESVDHFFKDALDTFEGAIERVGNNRL
ncbi:MAG TPA: alpha/beta family hydrolase [Bryobacteraceae bacterium]|nr:alpha/beta family hydrolase [Bryobacteraceae bacterium]